MSQPGGDGPMGCEQVPAGRQAGQVMWAQGGGDRAGECSTGSYHTCYLHEWGEQLLPGPLSNQQKEAAAWSCMSAPHAVA
jgi:hypothetical protein